MLTDVYTNPELNSGPSGSLPPPFDKLVTDQTLTEVQARAVLAALAVQTRPETKRPEPKTPRVGIAARLAEIGAYLGAALVVAAGIVVVAQQWSNMSYAVRVSVMVGTTLALLLAAVGIVLFTRGRPWDDLQNGDALRRLSGALFTLGAGAASGTVMVAMLSGQDRVTGTEAWQAVVVAGLTAFAVLVVARLRADTPLGEAGLVAASVAVAAGGMQLWLTDDDVAMQWTLLALGLAWALVATFTAVLRHHTLVTALGLLLALFASATIAEVTWSHRLALVTLIVVSLAMYLTRPTWPYMAAATVAAVVLTVTWVGEAVGAAVALLAAGLVILVLAGGALLLHMRSRSDQKEGTPVR
jgi:hypothetical protein